MTENKKYREFYWTGVFLALGMLLRIMSSGSLVGWETVLVVICAIALSLLSWSMVGILLADLLIEILKALS